MADPERIGVYICHCGTSIADSVDIKKVAETARGLKGVAIVRDHRFLCAESGQKVIQDDIGTLQLSRVVVAACTPLMHETTFRRASQAAGLNPFNVQVANIREQVAWITHNREEATAKSRAAVTGAVHRVVHHEPLQTKTLPVSQTVLVVGAGVTGIEAALRLAEAGKKVILVEREPSIGGHMALLDRTFPTLDCSACILVPKMAHVAEHPNVTLLTNTDVEEVGGFVGSFRVRVRQRPRCVEESLCTGCGLCVEKCPWGDIPSEYDQGMGTRSAMHFPFPQAVPHLPLIDREHCAYFQSDTCKICQDVCPTDAIDFEQKGRSQEFEVGAIILATGFKPFDPTPAVQYGYGRWDNILTSLQFERLCHPSGPTGGRIVMKDGRTPKRVAVLHCVGSRDVRFNPYCSRICCMSSMKTAMLARQRTGATVFSFYIDIRAVGKYCEEFYEKVQRSGVVFIHGKGTEVIFGNGQLMVKAEDTVLGRRVIVPVDMVVLGVGFVPHRDATEVARRFGVGCTQEGFFMERQVKFAPVQTANEGVFIAGACQSPKDIPDCVVHGGAAAAGALGLLDKGVVDTLPNVARIDPQLCSGCGVCLSDCPYNALEAVSDGEREVVRIEEVLCAGCGSCVATCPAGAITQFGYTRQQLMAEIQGLLARDRESSAVRSPADKP